MTWVMVLYTSVTDIEYEVKKKLKAKLCDTKLVFVAFKRTNKISLYGLNGKIRAAKCYLFFLQAPIQR